MIQLLKKLNFDQEEIEWLEKDLQNINAAKIEKIILLLINNGCSNEFVKDVLFNHKRILEMDLERINYILEAILSNGDIIEETLLELV